MGAPGAGFPASGGASDRRVSGVRLGLDARTLDDRFPGIGRYVRHLAEGLLESLAPDDRLFLLVRAGGDAGRLGTAGLDRATRDPIGPGSSPFSLRAPRAARRWSAARRLDVVHSPYLLGVRRAPCPVVLTWHDAIPWSLPAAMPSPWRRLAFRVAGAGAVRRAARVVTPSRASRDELVRMLGRSPAAPVEVVPHAADPRFRPTPAAASAAAAARLGITGPWVLCLAGSRPHKNVSGLLAAWGAVPEAVAAGWTLVVVGPDDRRFPEPGRRFRELAPRRRLRWLEAVEEEDLPALYSGADLYVQPSFAEGFGLAVLEAMACGAPVACADVPALRETVGDPANVALFPPGDPATTARLLAALLGDPDRRRRLAERGRRRAGELSWRRTAEAMLAIYRAVAAEERA